MSEADDDEAEYQYHRHRALVRPHRPLSEQNITDTRGSHLGLAPFSPSGIGCSADASYAFMTASNNVQQDCAPAYILDSETRNQPEHLVSQHSVFSSAWSNNVSQVSPDRDQNSHFGEDAFITQNQIFYRKQYEQVFKFSDPYPTNQIIRNNIDGGDVLSQQYLQRIIAESSVTAARKMHGPSRGIFVNDSWRQSNKGPYKCYVQRCPDSNSISHQKEESTTAAPD